MKIEISEEQFNKLLKLVYLGNLIVNDFRGTKSDPRVAGYDEVEELFFRMAHDKGDVELVRFDMKNRKYCPSMTFECDEEMDSYIKRYNDDLFWDELAARLAERDVAEIMGEEVFSKLEDAEAGKILDEAEQKYFEEFDENGLDNLRIVPGLEPGSRMQ